MTTDATDCILIGPCERSMPRPPTDPSLPETLPLTPRLRVVGPSLTDVTQDASDLSAPVREQVLRGKQLLLQLKELSQHDPEEILRPTLAALRLAMRSLEQDHLTLAQLDDIRAVLDVITHDLNHLSHRQRRDAVQVERVDILAAWIQDVTEGEEVLLDGVRDLARQLFREHLHHAPPMHWHEADPRSPAAWAAAHGLNTAQVLLRMMTPEGATHQEIFNALLAGLTHDLGMATLSGDVLAVREPVTARTRQEWRQHPAWGARHVALLLRHDEAPVADAIAQHHERLDGSGYPEQHRGNQITPLGGRLAVADNYAALCQARPHRPAYSPRTATQLLLQEAHAGRLDEAAVLSLLPWGLAPPGAVVELSDGSLARVIAWGGSARSDFTPRPVLAPLADQPTVLDLEQARDRHLIRVLPPGQPRHEPRAEAS